VRREVGEVQEMRESESSWSRIWLVDWDIEILNIYMSHTVKQYSEYYIGKIHESILRKTIVVGDFNYLADAFMQY